MASSSVEKNVVGSLCAGRSARKTTQTQPERDRRERHAPTEMASIGECDRHRGADATASSPGRANAFRRAEQGAGRRAGGRDILPPCPQRASCVSTPSTRFALAAGVHARALFGDSHDAQPRRARARRGRPRALPSARADGHRDQRRDRDDHRRRGARVPCHGCDAHPLGRRARRLRRARGSGRARRLRADPRGLPRRWPAARSRFRADKPPEQREDACPSST